MPSASCLISLIFLAGGQDPQGSDRPAPEERELEKILSHHNRGVSLMERFDPARAVEEFRQVVQLLPQWIPGRINLAIALLNSPNEKHLKECKELLLAVQKDDPRSPHARYALGM